MTDPTPYVSIRVPLADRYLPQDMVDWLSEFVGDIYDATDSNLNVAAHGWAAWGLRSTTGMSLVTFKFDDPRKATLFKLTWGGL